MKRAALFAAWTGGILVAACIAMLVWDDVSARRITRGYDQKVAELQSLVREDAKHAPVLEAEHKRVAEIRRARKARINWISVVLACGAAVFLWGAKQLPAKRVVEVRKPVAGAGGAGVNPLADARGAGLPPSGPLQRNGGAACLDLSAVDEIVARLGRDKEAAIPILQAIQAHYRYLPDEALRRVCELSEITPAQVEGTSSFYAQMRRSPVGKHVVRVCHGTACHVSGARQITEELRRSLGIRPGEDTDPDGMFTVDEVACLGCCSLAPVMMVDQHTCGRLNPASARAELEAIEAKETA